MPAPRAAQPEPANDVIELPLHGRIAAGAPIEALEGQSTLPVPAALLGPGEHYALEVSGIDPGSLVIELTESTIMQNTEANLERFRDLKALGIRLAIDDFGMGYSSLSYLHRFPIDILKIDTQGFEQHVLDGAPDTLKAVRDWCEDQGAARVLIAAMAVKQHERCVSGLEADYTGFTVPDRYVFGYGMDINEHGRNLPGIYALK